MQIQKFLYKSTDYMAYFSIIIRVSKRVLSKKQKRWLSNRRHDVIPKVHQTPYGNLSITRRESPATTDSCQRQIDSCQSQFDSSIALS